MYERSGPSHCFLGILNLAHGDIRPEISYLTGISSSYPTLTAPLKLGQITKLAWLHMAEYLTFGFLGSQTEQFSLGSVYYFINYGFEVYRDRCLTEDPYDHGPKVVDLLQDMEFPNLDGNPLIDDIIDKGWHNQYVKVLDLAAHTKKVLHESPKRAQESMGTTAELADVDENLLEEDFRSKKEFCQNLAQRGLLQPLSSFEPEQIGFKLAWYRHSLKG